MGAVRRCRFPWQQFSIGLRDAEAPETRENRQALKCRSPWSPSKTTKSFTRGPQNILQHTQNSAESKMESKNCIPSWTQVKRAEVDEARGPTSCYQHHLRDVALPPTGPQATASPKKIWSSSTEWCPLLKGRTQSRKKGGQNNCLKNELQKSYSTPTPGTPITEKTPN